MPVTFYPFAAFIPDGSAYGQELDVLQNVLPVNRGARPHRQAKAVASVADGPVTGAWVHIYQSVGAEQVARPDADTTAGIWLPETGSTLFDRIDEEAPSDGDYIYAAGAPVAEVCKIRLSDIATPAAGDKKLRVRYRIQDSNSNWTLKVELVEGSTVVATDTINGAADTAYVQRETVIVPSPAVVDWTNLFFQFTATVPGAAVFLRPLTDDAVGSWTTQAGGTSNLFQAIDEAAADDADYVQSPVLTAGQSSIYTLNLGTSAQLWVAKAHTVRYRYFATNAGLSLTVTLLQGSTVIASWSHAGIAASAWVTAAQVLTTDQRAALKATGYANLKLKFEASYPTAVASTVSQFGRPDEDIENGGGGAQPWTGDTSPLYTNVDEAAPSDADAVASSDVLADGSFPERLVLGLGALVDPRSSGDHVLKVRARRLGTPAPALDVALLDGDTVIASFGGSDAAPAAFATFTYTLSASQADAITDYADLRVRLTRNSQARGVSYSWVELSVPETRRLRISFAELELPSKARAEVTWSELRTPSTDSTYRGDLPTILAGTRTKLYEVASAWTDRSKGGGYGPAGAVPGSWFFASWGNHVVATDLVDPVQWRQNNSGSFADLITSTTKPKARFCAAARGQLMLGGINLTNHEPDELYWSAVENIQDFEPATSTLCDFQRLVATPGQIMGLVGGEDVLAFKRRSLYVMRWLGDPALGAWSPYLISGSVGTPYPRSIVQGQGEVFFWGGESFYRLPPGGFPQPLGKGVISRYLTDTQFSDGAIRQKAPASMAEEDQRMVGAWDPHSGLVVWTYQGRNDTEWRHSRAVVYNPEEDRWAVWDISGANISAPLQFPNTINDDAHETKGLIGFDWDSTNSRWFRFDDANTYQVFLRTKTFPIAMEQDGRPRLVRLKGVLPVYTTNPGEFGATWPNISVQVEAWHDPRRVPAAEFQGYFQSQADSRNWFPHDLEGYFFRIVISMPPMSGKIVRSFDGVYLDWELRGS